LRTFLAIALILVTGAASFMLWGAAHAHRMAPSSSQIFIHGTPVCVTQRGGEIVAAVGECGFHESRPAPENPHVGLPPGHPPIDDEPFPGADERRRTLI
jgi:hypothetical protein